MNEFNVLKYSKKTQTAEQRGKDILVEHLYPSPNAFNFTERKKKIEERLYEVFQKYEDKQSKSSG